MAKSKSGGTRSLIRGRVGSDVYSIGKDGKGQRQQVVRSLAETVANPRSLAQMANRMYMSTVMQAVSAMSEIIDHSFDGVAKGQPSISEFIRRNYALVKADAIAHPANGNSFGLNKYQEKGEKPGAYVLSSGSVVKPAAIGVDDGSLNIALTADTTTVGGLKAALGVAADGYITLCTFFGAPQKFHFGRIKFSTTLPDDTALTSGNVASMFTFEGNMELVVGFANNEVYFSPQEDTMTNYAIIISANEDGVWKHSTAVFTGISSPAYTSDVALATYPVGNEAFLNGGDI